LTSPIHRKPAPGRNQFANATVFASARGVVPRAAIGSAVVSGASAGRHDRILAYIGAFSPG
jgi:hypothetical protein